MGPRVREMWLACELVIHICTSLAPRAAWSPPARQKASGRTPKRAARSEKYISHLLALKCLSLLALACCKRGSRKVAVQRCSSCLAGSGFSSPRLQTQQGRRNLLQLNRRFAAASACALGADSEAESQPRAPPPRLARISQPPSLSSYFSRRAGGRRQNRGRCHNQHPPALRLCQGGFPLPACPFATSCQSLRLLGESSPGWGLLSFLGGTAALAIIIRRPRRAGPSPAQQLRPALLCSTRPARPRRQR